MTNANITRTPRGFSRKDAKRSFIVVAVLAGLCVCYWFCLPVLQSLVIPLSPGGKDGPWVLRPNIVFRVGATAMMACVTFPVFSIPLRRKWAAEDAAPGSPYDPFHARPGLPVVFFVKAFLLLVVYASALLFYLLSWIVIGSGGIEEHLPWTTRKYSFQDIASLETIPAGGRTTSWASKGGPWYDISLKCGRTITLSEDNGWDRSIRAKQGQKGLSVLFSGLEVPWGVWKKEALFTKTKGVTSGTTRFRILRPKGRLHDSV